MTRLKVSAAAALLLFLASTADGSVVYTFPDPVPHATSGTGSVELEISSVVITVGSGNLGFTVNFATPIAAPSSFAADSVIGDINIDTTLNATTADLLATPAFGGTLDPTKVQYFVDLQSEAGDSGFVNLVTTASSQTTATLPITYTSDSFSVSVPLSDLGNSNGQVEFGVNVGTFSELTDQLAGSTATNVIPEPSGLVIWGLILATGVIMGMRRRGGR